MEKLLIAFLLFLVLVSAVQAYKLVELKSTVDEIRSIKPQYQPLKSSSTSSSGGLPQMVGGC